MRQALVAATMAALLAPAPAVAAPDWQRYVLGTGASDVTPVAVAATTGDVTNPAALVGGPPGRATLTWDGNGTAPSILLDYGKEVGSVPHFTVSAVSGAPVTMRAAYSEARRFMTDTGDTDQFPVTRYEDFRLAAPGTVTSQTLQGGFRFQRITLRSAGSVSLSAVGARVEFENAPPSEYQGWFLSSDEMLNRIWYSGAYTVQTDMAPPGTQYSNPEPWLLDGAKRDRAVWSGDAFVEGPTTYVSLGANGLKYVRGALQALARFQQPDGAMPGTVGLFGPVGVYYSLPYSIYFALTLADYYRYTGDADFARGLYAAFRRQMRYDRDQVDPSTGLIVAGSGPGQGSPVFGEGDDWDAYDPAKTGAVAAYNILYWRALGEAAWLARHLGESADAAAWSAQAGELGPKIDATFFDAARGVYKLSASSPAVPQDGNAQAVAFGLAGPRSARVLRWLHDHLWVAHGVLPFSADAGFSTNLSPFVSGFEVRARFAAGDASGALELLHHGWDPMVTPSWPTYTGTFWEKTLADGTVADGPSATSPGGFVSLSHGWATEPTTALSSYVLGVEPVEPGFATWVVRPEPGSLRWARGQVPTPHGPVAVAWTRSARVFSLRVTAPPGTSGTVSVPVPAHARTRVDGKVVRVRRVGGFGEIAGVRAGTTVVSVRRVAGFAGSRGG